MHVHPSENPLISTTAHLSSNCRWVTAEQEEGTASVQPPEQQQQQQQEEQEQQKKRQLRQKREPTPDDTPTNERGVGKGREFKKSMGCLCVGRVLRAVW